MKCCGSSFLVQLARLVFPAVLVISVSACAGTPSSGGGAAGAALEERAWAVLEEWQGAVREQDIDRYMSLHWDDAVKLNGEPNGVVDILEGAEEIRAQMEHVFAELGEFLSRHEYPPVEFSYDDSTDSFQFLFSLENPNVKEALRLKEKDGRLKVSEHWVFQRFFPALRTGELTAWVDEEGNGNGMLEPEEQERLFIYTYNVLFEPGGVGNPLDEFFDWNNNGEIEEFETEIAGQELLRNRMRRIDLFDAEFATHRVPPAGQEYVGIHDANWLVGAVVDSGEFIPIGPVEHMRGEDYELIDYNRDGIISPVEVDFYHDTLLRVAAVNPAPVTYNKYMPAFSDDIQRWIDADHNGDADEDEIWEAGSELFGLAQSGFGLHVWSPIQRFFDRNRDGFLSEPEVEWARDYIVELLLPAAVEMDIRVYNWVLEREVIFNYDFDDNPAVSPEEKHSMGDFIATYAEQFWQRNDPDGTPHRWIDGNDDGVIEMEEAEVFRDMLFHALMTVWMQLPGEESDSLVVRSALDEAADVNGDGILSVTEREMMIDSLTSPHSAGSEFDRKIDFDGNGELTMDEIHRAQDTGLIPAGEGSAERRVASFATSGASGEAVSSGVESSGAKGGSVGRQGSTSAPGRVKVVSTWGSSLAVLGVRDMTEAMKESQTDLLVSFLENAFVNYGNVTVVDRQNLEKIMEEYKYQTSALVDDKTAVEIGKLSGADAIAIGNLSRLSDTYYLHLKVINVQSGAIIGSSISEGLSEKDFLGMCNGAVEPLF